MGNNTLLEIGAKLLEAKRILLFPHMRMDGDALGSCVALCRFLRKKGKEAFVLIEDDIPENLLFMEGDYCIRDVAQAGWITAPEACVSVDCSDPGRFEKRREVFRAADFRICIDHHATSGQYADYNYIDPQAAATGEIVYDLLTGLGAEPDPEMANALFAAITTDTGNFCYSNTTKKTHEIAAALYDWGLDNCYVCNEIYDNMRREQLAIHSMALSGMETFAGGQAVLACVSQDMLFAAGADLTETEGIVEKLRSIRGVEMAALLKEEEPELIKVSLRAKSFGNVSAVAQLFDGGGHRKAAGCAIKKPLEEARLELAAAMERELEKEGREALRGEVARREGEC